MAVISSTIRREGWTGDGRVMEGDNFQIEHLVQCNDINDGPLSAALGAQTASPDPVPMPWAAYAIGNDLHPGVVVKQRSTRLHAYTNIGPIWIVTTKWENPGSDGEEEDSRTHPLLRPIKYRIEWANYTRIVTEEVAGQKRKIVNSAGDAFADPLEQDDQRPVLVAVKNVANLAIVLWLGVRYKTAVNTDMFYGAKRRHAKVQSITAGDLQRENEVSFYTMTIRVEFNDKEWDRSIVDQGMRYFEKPPAARAPGEEPIAAIDSNGTPLGAPINLQNDGTKLNPAFDAGFIAPAFRTYPEVDFSGLGI